MLVPLYEKLFAFSLSHFWGPLQKASVEIDMIPTSESERSSLGPSPSAPFGGTSPDYGGGKEDVS